MKMKPFLKLIYRKSYTKIIITFLFVIIIPAYVGFGYNFVTIFTELLHSDNNFVTMI